MPRFDGTGPRGDGPMTGRGEGYFVVELPAAGRPVRGYVGLQGAPRAWTHRQSGGSSGGLAVAGGQAGQPALSGMAAAGLPAEGEEAGSPDGRGTIGTRETVIIVKVNWQETWKGGEPYARL